MESFMKKVLIILTTLISLVSGALYSAELKNIESEKLYAYMILLFNENPHYVKQFENVPITSADLNDEVFNQTRYIKYMNTVSDKKIKSLAEELLNVYKNINSYSSENLSAIEAALEKENILAKFTSKKEMSSSCFDYIIYGRREKLTGKSLLFNDESDYYNIIPLYKYDDLSSSCVTFYDHCIYIKSEEIMYDQITFLDILSGKNSIQGYLGVPLNDNIRRAVRKAYAEKKCTLNSVRKSAESLLLGMQIAKDKLKIDKPELVRAFGISSVIYDSPYEGLIPLFAYLQYHKKTEYNIAGKSFLKFASDKTGDKSIPDYPSVLCSMTKEELKSIATDYHLYLMKNYKLY